MTVKTRSPYMRKRILANVLIISLSVFALSAFACSAMAVSAASDITLSDTDGKAVQLSSFKGKVIILDFFATWCPPCRQEIPDFIELQKQYGDKGLMMIGVSLTPAEDVKPFAEKLGINYTVLVGDDKSEAAYGPIRSIPTTFIIDKEFNVARKYIGFTDKEVFEKDVKELLSK